MKLIGNEITESILDQIHFKSSIIEILGAQKTQAIKTILNIVDASVDTQEVRNRIRKATLDGINDMHRVCVNILESLVTKHGEIEV